MQGMFGNFRENTADNLTQRREAALRMRSVACEEAACGMALGGARSEPAGLSALFLSLSRT